MNLAMRVCLRRRAGVGIGWMHVGESGSARGSLSPAQIQIRPRLALLVIPVCFRDAFLVARCSGEVQKGTVEL